MTSLNATVGGTTSTIFSGGSPGVAAYNSDDTSLPVLLDTGSSAWSVPTAYYNKGIAPLFTYVDQQGLCSCANQNNGDTITLEFGGAINIKVPAREFIVPIYNSTTNDAVPYDNTGDACAFMIVPADSTGQGFQTLGDAILRSMYVVFDLDNGQLSIAQAAVNSTASPNIVTVGAGASGIASAISTSYSSAPTNSYSIAAEVQNATASFSVSTAESTIGSATGTAAVPADAQVSASGVSTSGSGSSGAGATSSAAASGLVVPALEKSGLWVGGVVMAMAALGAGIML